MLSRVSYIYYGSACFLLLITLLMKPAPRSIGIVEGLYVLLVSVIFLTYLLELSSRTAAKKKIHYPSSYLYFPTFGIYLILFASGWIAFNVNNIPLSNWLRGLAPFLNYLLFLPLAYKAYDNKITIVLIATLLVSTTIVFILECKAVFENGFNLIESRHMLPVHAFQPYLIAAYGFCIGYASSERGKKKRAFLVMALILFFGITVTLTRAMILVAVALAILFIIKEIHHVGITGIIKGRFVHLAMLASFGGILSVPVVMARSRVVNNIIMTLFARLTSLKDISSKAHVLELYASWNAFLQHPILGNGLGYTYSYYRTPDFLWTGSYTHNVLSYVLMDLGIVGLLFFLILLFFLVIELIVTYRIVKKYLWNKLSLFWGMLFSLCGVCLYAMFQSVFRTIIFSLIWTFLLVGIIALREEAKRTKNERIGVLMRSGNSFRIRPGGS